MVSDKEKEKIQREARNILDSFEEQLGNVSLTEKTVKRALGGFREEGSGSDDKGEFRTGMFANAPEVEGDFIVAEKKQWQ